MIGPTRRIFGVVLIWALLSVGVLKHVWHHHDEAGSCHVCLNYDGRRKEVSASAADLSEAENSFGHAPFEPLLLPCWHTFSVGDLSFRIGQDPEAVCDFLVTDMAWAAYGSRAPPLG